jgi:NTP pyrophosphatase (non-canonical NTP hydrolase)
MYMNKNSNLTVLARELAKLRDSHGLKKVHNPKDLALALVVEATDILEHFQWKQPPEINAYLRTQKATIETELAVIINYILLMAHDFGIDIDKVMNEKIKADTMKYPLKIKGVRQTKI